MESYLLSPFSLHLSKIMKDGGGGGGLAPPLATALNNNQKSVWNTQKERTT